MQRAVCEHNRQRSGCKQCVGCSICEYNQNARQCKSSGGSSICEHSRESSKRKQFGGVEEHQRAQPPKMTTAASRISKACWRKKKAACLVVLPSRRGRSSSCQWSRLCARPCHYALDYLIHYLLNPFASWTQKRCFVRGFLPVGY